MYAITLFWWMTSLQKKKSEKPNLFPSKWTKWRLTLPPLRWYTKYLKDPKQVGLSFFTHSLNEKRFNSFDTYTLPPSSSTIKSFRFVLLNTLGTFLSGYRESYEVMDDFLQKKIVMYNLIRSRKPKRIKVGTVFVFPQKKYPQTTPNLAFGDEKNV